MRFKDTWTPLRLLDWSVPFLKGKGVAAARLEVEVMLARALGTDRLGVYLAHDRPLNAAELSVFRDLLTRRARRVPLAYLLGKREFYRLEFEVGKGVLIPRPESEHLVEGARKHLSTLPEGERTALDLGTGSGCLAVALALHGAKRVWAVDSSPRALAFARRNAERHGVADRVVFREGDWWDALKKEDPLFAVVVANPPYLTEEEWQDTEPEVRDHEPREALVGGADGLAAYRRIAEGLSARLAPGGRLFLELNEKLKDKITALFGGTWRVQTHPDLQGLPRVLEAEKALFP